MSTMTEPVTVRTADCAVCGSRELAEEPIPTRWIGDAIFRPHARDLGLSRCRGCDYVFVNPRPSEELLGRWYGGDEYTCHNPDNEHGTSAKAEAQLGIVEHFVPRASGDRFLDYGCGGGYLLSNANDRGWRAQGFDIGDAALANCRSRGLQVTSDLSELAGAQFDAIYLSHVFEHVVDQVSLLHDLRALLSSKGRLFIEVPNARSLRARLSHPLLSRRFHFDERYRAYPIHLSYFSHKTLPRFLKRHGLTVDGVVTTGFGIEELLSRSDEETAAAAMAQSQASGKSQASPRQAPLPVKLGKSAIKKMFFGMLLGENVIAVAH